MVRTFRIYYSVVGIRGLVLAIICKLIRKKKLLQIRRKELKFPVFLRVPSSDISVFHQIFINKEYNFNTKDHPQVIIDAGANIGLSSIYFSVKFPDAKIIAIEPEENNFGILEKNISVYKNIIPICAAVWNKNEQINLTDPGIGSWGFMTQEKNSSDKSYGKNVKEVQGMTIDKIMMEHGVQHLDVLKVDIEGSEREVFKEASAWIEKVDTIIVELHENAKDGCNSSFYRATIGFDNEWKQGELIYVTKNKGCVVPQ